MRIKHATAPPEPNIATAAFGSTRPAVTSASGIRLGYVGHTGFVSSASAARPIVVAQSHGIACGDVSTSSRRKAHFIDSQTKPGHP